MTKQTNNNPRSLDDYFARAKEVKPGMSAKQVSDLISAAPAAKISWLAYIKPFAAKINSFLILSALAVVTFLAVDVDDSVADKPEEIVATQNQTQEYVTGQNLEKQHTSNFNDQNEVVPSEAQNADNGSSNVKNTDYLHKNETSNELSASIDEDNNLIAKNLLISHVSNVIVHNELNNIESIQNVQYPLYDNIEQVEIEEPTETFQTLVDRNSKNMYYVQIDTKFNSTKSGDLTVVGGKIAWMPSNYLSFGLAGYGMANKQIVEIENQGELVDGNMYAGYGGFFAEYYLFPKSIVHGYIGGFFGLGGLRATPTLNNTPQTQSTNISVIWLVEPSFGIELNVVSFLKVGLDFSYRYSEVSGRDKFYAKSSDLTNFEFNGFTTGIYFKLGLY